MTDISIVITVFNRGKFLEETLESLTLQSASNLEILIWDDGSTDNSPAIAQQYTSQDPRIRYIRSPTNQGCAQALKSAIAQTTAPYIAWVDSDDLLHPTALAKTAAILDKYQSVGLVYTRYNVIDAAGKFLGLGKRSQTLYSKNQLLTLLVTFHFRLIRRSVYDQIDGINTDFPCAIDYDLCLRLSEVTDVYHIPEPLYDYRVHPDSISMKRQAEQQYWSKVAVERALKRRGLDSKYRLHVSDEGKFSLLKQDTGLL